MAKIPISPAARLAWQIAGTFAAETGSNEIEPVHLLFGVCSLEKVPETEARAASAGRDGDLHEELQRVGRILREAGVDTGDLLEKTRIVARRRGTSSAEVTISSRRLSRSDASRRLFKLASFPAAARLKRSYCSRLSVNQAMRTSSSALDKRPTRLESLPEGITKFRDLQRTSRSKT